MYHRRECSIASEERNEKWRIQKWNVKTNYLIMKAVWEAFNLNSELNETSKRVEQAEKASEKERKKMMQNSLLLSCCMERVRQVQRGEDWGNADANARSVSIQSSVWLKLSKTRYVYNVVVLLRVCMRAFFCSAFIFYFSANNNPKVHVACLLSLSLIFHPTSKTRRTKNDIYLSILR